MARPHLSPLLIFSRRLPSRLLLARSRQEGSHGGRIHRSPGTGKTMLAKAIAKESGAVFINVRISNLMSKWFGDAQKLVAAVFSLPHKLQPVMIFIDEVDNFLGQRCATEHEAMTNMKMEFTADRVPFERARSSYCISYHWFKGIYRGGLLNSCRRYVLWGTCRQ